jgi:hypothetical protein
MPQLVQEKREEAHSPTLNTVLMVEETLKNAKQIVTLAELKRQLPRQVMHTTLLAILDYLQISGKIVIGTKGILWVFAEREELDRLINRGIEL